MSKIKDASRFPPFRVPDPAMSLNVVPPFPLQGVTARVFPLRASLEALQQFCDSYLNIIPPELGYFRACSPLVQLTLLNYGRLAVKIRNVGWMSQREVLFNIPLEWYKLVDGKLQFYDWATIAPFIYVDDDMSMNAGRMVYGWPKTIARLSTKLSSWLVDPLAPLSVATASTMVFPELYRGRRLEERDFLEVLRSAPLSSLHVPFDGESPWAPWSVASNLSASIAKLSGDALGMLRGLGVWPIHEGTSSDNYLAMGGRLAGMGFPLHPGVQVNTLNLKQFRRSEEPAEFCYQALTNGPLKISGFNRAGLLGESHVLLGDVTGGYHIKLHEWPSLPIVDLLGLEVTRRVRGELCDVAEVQPVLPFWYDVDMEYLAGSVVAWRTKGEDWADDAGTTYPPRKELTKFERQTDRMFVTTLGASQAALAGPFRFTNTTIRVLPLVAERARLQYFLDHYLNKAEMPGRRFDVWAAEGAAFGYVYLTATSFGDVTSPTNNIGDWANFEMSFLVPVLRKREIEGEWVTVGVGFVPAQTFVDTVTAAASWQEIPGIPTAHATFVEPETTWMQDIGPSPDALQTLLRVDAEVEPALGEGQKMERREVVAIAEGVIADDIEGLGWRITADEWAAILREELERKKAAKVSRSEALKHARALALELLGNRLPFSFFTLKQIRDISDPTRACYQSLVRIQRTLHEVLEIQEIERPLVVRLFEYPTYPIATILGLQAKQIPTPGEGIVWAIQPIRPFWLRATVDESLGEQVLFRARSQTWKPSSPQPDDYLNEKAAVGVGAETGIIQDQGDPRRLAKTALDWRISTGQTSGQRNLTVAEARSAIETIDPQTVLESILSREWGNWSEQSRWRQGRNELIRDLEKHLSGVPFDERDAEERRYFETMVESFGKRPGEPVIRTGHANRMLESLTNFVNLRRNVEHEWELIAAAIRRVKGPPMRSKAVRDAVSAFRDTVVGIANTEYVGDPRSGDRRMNYAPQDDVARMLELVSLDREKESAESLRKRCSEAIELAWRRCKLQREALLTMLSKRFQKPDFVIRRDSAGPERERLFPLAESWDDTWYVGPPASTKPAATPPKRRTAPRKKR